MLYDFGKVKSGVDVEEAKVQVEQANVLVSVDTLALMLHDHCEYSALSTA